MDDMAFDKKVKEAMCKNVNPKLVGGKWHGKEYPHIYKDRRDNFLDGEILKYSNIKGVLFNEKVHYHQGASNMNSSQVMCINFFHKFFEKPEWEKYLTDILRKVGVPLTSTSCKDAIFEYVPDKKEYTNFDFYMVMDDGKHISFEIKYTESEFGSPNSKTPGVYHDKWLNTYQKMVSDCEYLDCNEDCFYKNFQINRNVCYASAGDIVVFLTPRANNSKRIRDGRDYIDSMHGRHSNIMNLYWEDIAKVCMEVVADNDELADYYRRFNEKYIAVL